MRPVTANGITWRVIRVPAGDPRLVDREGRRTVGTTDPLTETICISESLRPPMLDRVLLHEVSHALAVSYNRLADLRRMFESGDCIGVEEWAAQMMERHSIEAAALASESIGRPICVGGWCND